MASFETYQAVALQQAFAIMQAHGDQEPRCAAACEMVLRSNGAVDPKLLLKTALNKCSASFLRRVFAKNPSYIHMVFNDGSRPMHIAAESFVDG